MSKKAMKLALEASDTNIEIEGRLLQPKGDGRVTLVQQEQGEPVATDDFFKTIADRNPNPFPTPQRTWVGLTSEDYNEIFEKARTGEHAVQLAEAKLKEKNT